MCRALETLTRHFLRLRPIGLALRAGAVSPAERDLTDLFQEWTITIGNNDASYGLKQNSILGRNVVGELYQDAATAVIGVGFSAGGNQCHDLVVEWLPVTRLTFVPDHQVNRGSF